MSTSLKRVEGTPGAPLPRLVDAALDAARSVEDLLGGLLPLLADRFGADDAILWLRDAPEVPLRHAGHLRDGPADPDDELASRTAADPATTWSEGAEFCALAIPATHGRLVTGVVELRGRTLRRPDPIDFDELALVGRELGRFLRLVRAEEEVVLARATFRLPEEGLPVIAYIDALDGHSRTLYISVASEELLGYAPQDWYDDPDLWTKLLHPDDRDRVIEENEDAEPSGRFRAEYRMVTRDGRTRWFFDEAVLVEEDGKPVFWRGYLIDVTDRKEAETTREAAETRYRVLVENIPAIVYIEELDGRTIRYISPQLEAITGYTVEERIANAALTREIVHPEDRDGFVAAGERAKRTGGPYCLEYRIRAKDGRTVWLHDDAALIRDDRGEPLFWQGVAFDVTRLKEAEAERQRLLTHVVSAHEEERSRIAYDVHDGPVQRMTVADLRLQMLERHLTEEGHAMLDGVQATVREAIADMRQLLVELRPPALDEGLATALRDYVAATARTANTPVAVWDTELTSEPEPTTRTVAYRIAQEAIANARKHAQADAVEVRLTCRDGGLHVRVRDDGKGFDPEGVQPVAGHIGMQAMRERAELAGGWLRVVSAPGEGATVEFWLPDRPGSGYPPIAAANSSKFPT